MAYPNNYYQPNYYQPNYYQPDMRQQTQSQFATNQPITRPSVQTSIMWANDDTEAENALVLANNTVIIMLRDMSKFYIKSADNIGRQSMDVYECKKVSYNAEKSPKTPEKNEKTIDFDNFATKDDIAKLQEKIKNNEAYITRTELDDILGNISVTAKPKKTKAKVESEDDE